MLQVLTYGKNRRSQLFYVGPPLPKYSKNFQKCPHVSFTWPLSLTRIGPLRKSPPQRLQGQGVGCGGVSEPLLTAQRSSCSSVLSGCWPWASAILQVLIQDHWPPDVCSLSFSPVRRQILFLFLFTSLKMM